MKKEYFERLMSSLTAHIESCEKYFSHIHTTEDLKSITLGMAQELQEFCRQEEAAMSKIAMVDTYHIIGMGNLTPPQMMQFTYTLQKYLSYRSNLKTFAANFDKISALPNIPVGAKFKISLGDLELTSGSTNALEDFVSQDYNALKLELETQTTKLPFSLQNRNIIVDLNRFEDFISEMKEILKTELSLKTALAKIRGHNEYFGIQWQKHNSSEAVGVFKSNDIYNRVKDYYIGKKEKLAVLHN